MATYLQGVTDLLKRVSGLDLSLQQNVSQAMQVFKPYYENNYLMKDVAWTKNYNSTMSRAMSLQNSKDKDVRQQYWPTGIEELKYRKEDFRNEKLENILNYDNVTYTPYVNAVQTYYDLADKLEISREYTAPENGYMVRRKNGELILPTLQQTFLAEYSGNPGIQKVYATEAYVRRKRDIQERSQKFNGDVAAAEKDYLQEKFKFLKDYSAKAYENASENVTVTQNKKANVEKDIESGDVNFAQNPYLAELERALGSYNDTKNNAKQVNDAVNGGSRTPNTTGPTNTFDELNLENLDLARLTVDSGIGSFLAEQDIMQAASNYSHRGEIYDVTGADPYAMKQLEFQNSLKLKQLDWQHDAEMKALERQDKATEAFNKYKIDNKLSIYDANGNIIDNPLLFNRRPLNKKTGNTDPTIVDVLKDNWTDLKGQAKTLMGDTGYIPTFLGTIQNLKNELTNEELNDMMSHVLKTPTLKNKVSGKTGKEKWESFWSYYSNNKDEVGTDLIMSTAIFKMRNKFENGYALKNAGNNLVMNYFTANNGQHIMGAEKMREYYQQFNDIKKVNNDRINNALMLTLKDTKYSDQSKKEIINLYRDKFLTGKIDEDQFDELVDKYIINRRKEKRIDKSNVDYVGIAHKTEKGGNPDFDFNLNNLARSSPGAGAIQRTHERLEVPELGKLNAAYHSIISNASPETGLLSTSGTTMKGGQAAYSSTPSVYTTKLDVFGTPGSQAFFQAFDDIRRINFKQSGYEISTHGVDKSDNKLDVGDYTKIKNLITQLSYTSRGKDAPYIDIIAHKIANEDKTKSAIQIKIPRDILEKHLKGDDGEVDAALVNQIDQNGVTFIANKNDWNVDMLKSMDYTPLQAILNAKTSVSYHHPYNAGGYEIEKLEGNDYRFKQTLYAMDENGRKVKIDAGTPTFPYGNYIDAARDDVFAKIQMQNQLNLEQYRKFHANGQTDKMLTAEKEFKLNRSDFGFK